MRNNSPTSLVCPSAPVDKAPTKVVIMLFKGTTVSRWNKVPERKKEEVTTTNTEY
jgi:hypothetical protein